MTCTFFRMEHLWMLLFLSPPLDFFLKSRGFFCIFLKKGVPSSIMHKFIYKSGRTQSAQGREICP